MHLLVAFSLTAAAATVTAAVMPGHVRGLFSRAAGSQSALVDYMVHKRGVLQTPRVIAAMKAVDRRYYINPKLSSASEAYEDHPLPLGHGQTISAPHMHAVALQLLSNHLKPGARALDIGSGTLACHGYLTACMALLVSPDGFVLGIEKEKDLAEASIDNIRNGNPEIRPEVWKIMAGDALAPGVLPHDKPFDAIHVGAAADTVPQALLARLAEGGRMVIPVGPQHGEQVLQTIDKQVGGGYLVQHHGGVAFVPLTKPTQRDAGEF